MNPIQQAIEELEQKMREPFHGLHDGIAFALAILRRHLAGTAMVDVHINGEPLSCTFCLMQCCGNCNVSHETVVGYIDDDERPEWCPAYITKENDMEDDK